MTKIPDKGITQIDYNYLNLPFHITQQNPTTYQYRADGVKLDKTFTVNNTDGSATVHTQYLDGFQYTNSVTLAGRAILNSDDPEVLNSTRASEIETFQPVDYTEDLSGGGGGPIDVNAMKLQFFPTAEGFYDYDKKQYIYQYKDHLGNVRLSFGRNTETQELEVLDFNNYYSFGMNFSTAYSVFDATGTPFNYKYNGKELQETGMYDYGARFYMPDVGRWMSPDPLSEQYRRWSPYNYAVDNPIRFTDPDGRSVDDWRNKKGQLVYDPKANGGKGAYTQYASGTEMKYGEGLRNSGPKGASQFNKLVNSPSKIALNIDSESKAQLITTPTGNQGKGYRLGDTDVGRIAATANKAETEVVKVAALDTMIITINTGQIKELQSDLKSGAQKPVDEQSRLIKDNDLTVDEIAYSTFGHEIEHTTDENLITGFNKPAEEEKKPTEIGNQILKETIDGKNKK